MMTTRQQLLSLNLRRVDPQSHGEFSQNHVQVKYFADAQTVRQTGMDAARDRDKTRQLVLEHLGWTIIRVWSTDWWYDPATAIDRVHTSLTELLEIDRTEPSAEPDGHLDQRVDMTQFDNGASAPTLQRATPAGDERSDGVSSEIRREPLIARQASPRSSVQYYTRAELADASDQQNQFFDEDYSGEIRTMALTVLDQESPIRDDVLARRVARAHGFRRTGAKLRERVLKLIQDIPSTLEQSGRFLWNSDGPQKTVPFRYARDVDERRSVD